MILLGVHWLIHCRRMRADMTDIPGYWYTVLFISIAVGLSLRLQGRNGELSSR